MKQKRYWLRGGLLLVILAVVIDLILRALNIGSPVGVPGIFSFVVLQKFGCYFLGSWSGNEPSYCPVLESVSVIAVSIIFYFIVGAIVGWIIGKIKNRHSLVS